MNVEPRWAMLALMSALRSRIVSLNAIADELVQGATVLHGEPGADAMRGLAQLHRVRALEMEGQLAALNADYVSQFNPEP